MSVIDSQAGDLLCVLRALAVTLKKDEEKIQTAKTPRTPRAAYNAAELAVKSLILKLDDDLPGSHGGLVGRFGELYIKTGLYERALGRRLNQVLQLRNQARYKYQAAIKQDDAEGASRLAKALIELAEKDLN